MLSPQFIELEVAHGRNSSPQFIFNTQRDDSHTLINTPHHALVTDLSVDIKFQGQRFTAFVTIEIRHWPYSWRFSRTSVRVDPASVTTEWTTWTYQPTAPRLNLSIW